MLLWLWVCSPQCLSRPKLHAGPVGRLWHSELPNPRVHPFRTRPLWYSTTLVLVLLQRVMIQSGMARRRVQASLSFHWGTARLCHGSPSLLRIHHLPWSDYPLTHFFLPLLCWWYPALFVLPTRWPNCLSMSSACLNDISKWANQSFCSAQH